MSGMGLYHLRFSRIIMLLLCLSWSVPGCSTPPATQAMLSIDIMADGKRSNIQVPPKSSVEKALQMAGITLGSLDRTIPPLLTILEEPGEIQVVRVTESFTVEQETIPFTVQTLKNEALPQDQEYLIQKGKNGLQEITYRRVYEDGIEIANQPVPIKVVTLEEPVPEILMVGLEAPFAPVDIPGRILYLRDGNVWMMEKNTANRSALLTTGDLDGRVFEISRDGAWLLFTRSSQEEGQINTLWVTNLSEAIHLAEDQELNLIDLRIANIVHFADFSPIYSDRIVFSTVEPRIAPPGWQANNNLVALTFSESGWTADPAVYVDTNAGGIYGWWGMDYSWAPDGSELAYTRPDGVGLVDFATGTYTNSISITPYQTGEDWAWVPGISWTPDGKSIITIDHPLPGGSDAAESAPNFNLDYFQIDQGSLIPIKTDVGMFAYPLASPFIQNGNGEMDYKIAYLQALLPNQSETSTYRLGVMDRDGSNPKEIFPANQVTGMVPNQNWGAWSPAPLPDSGNPALIVIYQGNLWIVDTVLDNFVQITGDELTNRVIWTNLPLQDSGN